MYLAAMGPPKHTVQIRQHGGKIGVILNSHASSAAPRRGISFFSEPQFREAVPHRRDTRQLPKTGSREHPLEASLGPVRDTILRPRRSTSSHDRCAHILRSSRRKNVDSNCRTAPHGPWRPLKLKVQALPGVFVARAPS